MNELDIVILCAALFGLVKGFFNGLIKETTGLLAIVLGIYISTQFSSIIEPYFYDSLKEYQLLVPILAFAILFVSVVVFIKLLGYFIDKLTKFFALALISKILGSIFGGASSTIVIGFLLVLELQTSIIPENIKVKSVLYQPTTNLVNKIIPTIKSKTKVFQKFQKKIDEKKEKLENKINSK